MKEKCPGQDLGIRGDVDVDPLIMEVAKKATCKDDTLTCCHDNNELTDETKFCSDVADEGFL